MGWGKDMLFLGGYLSPAVLAEELEVEFAAEALAPAPGTAAARTNAPATARSAVPVVRAAAAPARPCA